MRRTVLATFGLLALVVVVSSCGLGSSVSDDGLDRYHAIHDRLEDFRPDLCATVPETAGVALDVWPGSPEFSNSGLFAVCRFERGTAYLEVRAAFGRADMNEPFFDEAVDPRPQTVKVGGASQASVVDQLLISEPEWGAGFTLIVDAQDDLVHVVSSGAPRDPERLAAAVEIAEAVIELRDQLAAGD